MKYVNDCGSSSTKTTLVAGEARCFDAGKKVNGRKRHTIVDTLLLILAVVIQSASMQDRNGADKMIGCMENCWYNVKKSFADGDYSGKLAMRVKKAFGIQVQILNRNELN